MTIPSDQPDGLAARVAYLERERRAVFEDAQREADAVFAQYQLSQLLASGEALEPLAMAVLTEIARSTGASGGALWLREPADRRIRPVAAVGDDLPELPAFDRLAQVERWVARLGWPGVALEETRESDDGVAADGEATGYLAIRPPSDGSLDPGHHRYLALIRRELSITFQAAQLRTSLGQERAMLGAILEGASDGILAVDADRRLVELNPAAARLLRMDRRRAIGSRCEDVLGCVIPDEGPRGRMDDQRRRCGETCPFADVLADGRPIAAREQTVRGRERGSIPVAVSYAPTSGGPVRAVAVVRDLRPGLALDQMRSSFVASVSHELRTPLALIRGYAQSLLHLDLDEATARRHLERIDEGVSRLTELVDAILDTSLLESDRLPLHRSTVDVGQLLRSFAADEASLGDIPPLKVMVEPDLPTIEADPERIRQVLANLVTNSAKYAGPATRITISARPLQPRTVVITVADDGIGIDPAEREQVFERFYRGRVVRESHIAGSGLGLYLCRRLVESHGGWIRLDATLRGTSVSFGLPVTADQP
jgi:signal transduction histidine kinase